MSEASFHKAIFATMGYCPKIDKIRPGKIATIKSKNGLTEVFAILLNSGKAGLFGSFGFSFEAGDVPRTPYQVHFWHSTTKVEDLHKATAEEREELERDILGTFRTILDEIENGKESPPFWLDFFAAIVGGARP